MAVDTRNRRASVLGLALAARLVLPAPDGAIGQADRQHQAQAYSGISAAAAVAVSTAAHTSTSAGAARTSSAAAARTTT